MTPYSMFIPSDHRKCVSYANASSAMADHLGCPNGCYYVAITEPLDDSETVLSSHATLEEALAAAEILWADWSGYSLRSVREPYAVYSVATGKAVFTS